jgi:hypothetical protein
MPAIQSRHQVKASEVLRSGDIPEHWRSAAISRLNRELRAAFRLTQMSQA